MLRAFLLPRIALQALVELFDKHQAISHLQAFVSDNARRIYNISATSEKGNFNPETVYSPPKIYGTVTPMFADRELPWSIAQIN